MTHEYNPETDECEACAEIARAEQKLAAALVAALAHFDGQPYDWLTYERMLDVMKVVTSAA